MRCLFGLYFSRFWDLSFCLISLKSTQKFYFIGNEVWSNSKKCLIQLVTVTQVCLRSPCCGSHRIFATRISAWKWNRIEQWQSSGCLYSGSITISPVFDFLSVPATQKAIPWDTCYCEGVPDTNLHNVHLMIAHFTCFIVLLYHSLLSCGFRYVFFIILYWTLHKDSK